MACLWHCRRREEGEVLALRGERGVSLLCLGFFFSELKVQRLTATFNFRPSAQKYPLVFLMENFCKKTLNFIVLNFCP